MEMPARIDIGILGLWWGQAVSGAVLSSGRSIRAGLRAEGWRERVFLTPGMCTIWNRYSEASSLLGCTNVYSGCLPAICHQRVCKGACDRLQ